MILFAVTCHQKQKKDDQKIAGIDILWEQISQKVTCVCVFVLRFFSNRRRWAGWICRRTWRFCWGR